jgi:leucyl-tRNA synthetase
MRQWLLRITAYADRLAKDLDLVDWSENVKDLQRNWIGRSEGAVIRFKVKGMEQSFEVFTSRPETLFGCTFCVLAPEHSLTLQITTLAQRPEVEEYIARCASHSERDRLSGALEKSGAFTGAVAQHPLTGEDVSIWIADYVLPTYGSGAVFACPAHDQRDFEFAQVHGLDLIQVVNGPGEATELPYPGEGMLCNSQFLNGMDTKAAKKKITDHLAERGVGGPKVNYNLRDWLFSRQRYWGEPIPILFNHGKPESDPRLPVVLPDLAQLAPAEAGEATPPLARAREWPRTTSPRTEEPVIRETNVMPQWAGSCWYFLRFIDPRNEKAAFDPTLEAAWMPVDLYMGGTEHATLHLLYARFWHKVLFDAGLVSTVEPFKRLFNQGKVQARSFRDQTGKYFYPHEVVEKDGHWFTKDGTGPLQTRFEKMSKSRYNVASPDDVVAEHGADSLRLYEMFMGPIDQDNLWQGDGLFGTSRFLARVWRLIGESLLDPPDTDEEVTTMALNRLIKNVTTDLEHLHLNTAISHMMSFLNETTRQRRISRKALDAFIRVLAPFAPHVAEELWERLGNPAFILDAAWPSFDPAKTIDAMATIVVQVNGRKRAQVVLPRGATEASVIQEAIRLEPVRKATGGNLPVRVIYMQDKIINLVFT